MRLTLCWWNCLHFRHILCSGKFMLKHEALRNCFLVNILDGGIASPPPDVFSSEDLLLVFMSLDARAVLECLVIWKKYIPFFSFLTGFTTSTYVTRIKRKNGRFLDVTRIYVLLPWRRSSSFVKMKQNARSEIFDQKNNDFNLNVTILLD